MLILGDFNVHVDDRSDTYGIEFCEVLDSFGLINHVTIPTHESGHTLDLIITRNNDELLLTKPRGGYFISDHCFVSTRLDIPRPDLQVKTVSFRSIKDMDMTEFRTDLEVICQNLIEIDDVSTLAKEYNSQLLECLDKHAPVMTKSFIERPKMAYFDRSLKEAKKDRRKAENEWRKDKDNVELHGIFKKNEMGLFQR